MIDPPQEHSQQHFRERHAAHPTPGGLETLQEGTAEVQSQEACQAVACQAAPTGPMPRARPELPG